jgi:hypothetical protein
MNSRSLIVKSLGLLLCLSTPLLARQVEFQNKSKLRIVAALGKDAKSADRKTAHYLGPNDKMSATIGDTEKPYFFIIDRDVKYVYLLDAEPKKNIKLTLSTGLISKKTELEPQRLAINNIKKENIKLVGSGMSPFVATPPAIKEMLGTVPTPPPPAPSKAEVNQLLNALGDLGMDSGNLE